MRIQGILIRTIRVTVTILAIVIVGPYPFRAAAHPSGMYVAVYPRDDSVPDHSQLESMKAEDADPRRFDRSGSFWQSSSILLPDLRTLPPEDLKIVQLSGGLEQLRLSNTIWNSGPGPLELAGELDRATRQTIVQQRIKTGSDQVFIHPVGEFVWHPTHDHWHFADFTIYELWSLSPNGHKDAIVSSSDKLSYCLIDTDAVDQRHPAFVPYKRYGGCGQQLQGLSSGWGDTYKSHLDGQTIDISQVADGIYALVSRTNPTGMVIEDNEHNNSATILIEILGSAIRVIDERELSEEFCLQNGRC